MNPKIPASELLQRMITKRAAKDFPIVCVGGSAGGLDAYTRLLRHLPVDICDQLGSASTACNGNIRLLNFPERGW